MKKRLKYNLLSNGAHQVLKTRAPSYREIERDTHTDGERQRTETQAQKPDKHGRKPHERNIYYLILNKSHTTPHHTTATATTIERKIDTNRLNNNLLDVVSHSIWSV